MLERSLSQTAFSGHWGRQMRFVLGPRQCGKTTIARGFLEAQGCGRFYYNWDHLALSAKLRRDPDFFISDIDLSGRDKSPSWVCFDELHKQSKWKRMLKGWFDEHEARVRFIVTGSAALAGRRRAGESLAGRFLAFHLHPLGLGEVARQSKPALSPPPKDAADFVMRRIQETRFEPSALEALLALSGFPEPFLKSSESFFQRWRRSYGEAILKEDIRDITRVQDLSGIAALLSLLPETVGSPLSLNSLRGDIGPIHFNTAKNYLAALGLAYLIFELPVYSRSIRRSVRKEKKAYFFDWTRPKLEGARFENYAAVELLRLTALWSDAGLGNFGLSYVRQATGRETDFLITREDQPWLLVEAKLKDQPIAIHHFLHAEQLGRIPIVQLCRQENIALKGKQGDFRVSASRFFSASS